MKVDHRIIKEFKGSFYTVPVFKVFSECSCNCQFNIYKTGCVLEDDEFNSSYMVMEIKNKRCRR